MEPVTLIATALAAKGAGSASVERAVSALRARVGRLLAHRPHGELVLAKHASEPEIWRAPLEQELREAGAADDPDVVSDAQTLMTLVDEEGARRGEYVVSVRSSRGVQIGDRNTQTNYFSFPPVQDEVES